MIEKGAPVSSCFLVTTCSILKRSGIGGERSYNTAILPFEKVKSSKDLLFAGDTLCTAFNPRGDPRQACGC